jgi:hypothetical protein
MNKFALRPAALRIALGAAALFFAGCSNNAPAPDASTPAAQTPASSTDQSAAPQTGQMTFASPEEAGNALKDAIATKNRRQLVSLFGAEGKQLIFSGDRVQEENELSEFGGHLSEHLRVDHPAADKAVLYVGNENWPFPIPLIKSGDQWHFDTDAGKEELLNRRIGENELNAIAVCRAYVAAQKEYARQDRTGEHVTQYARHFMSTSGKKDGLYWAAAEGEELSPMGPLVAQARAEGYEADPAHKTHQPYQGYFFHILTGQGDAAPGGRLDYLADGHLTKGVALIAYPDKWGSSGIMSFIVNQDGKVYQKNLGDKTIEAAKAITEYNPDNTWAEVKD